MNFKLSRENIWLILVCFTLGSFAFSERINSWGIIFMGAFFLIDKTLVRKIKGVKFDEKLIPPVGFFLLYLVFYLFSDKDGSAGHAVFSKFTFLLLPLLFYYENYFNKRNERIILMIFSILLTCGFLYELSLSLYTHYFNSPNPRLVIALGRMQISDPIMHPGYYSNYFMLGIIWHYFNRSKYSLLFIALFTIVLLLLLSRIVLIFYMVFAVAMYIRHIMQSANPLITGLMGVVLGIIAVVGLYNIPSVKRRVDISFKQLNNKSKDIDINSATDTRMVAYIYEMKLIAAKPILGYGLGNTRDVLRKTLVDNGYIKLGKEMNNHNQYFKTWMQLGILGILGLIWLLYSFFYYFRKEKLATTFWFTLLVTFGLLTDDMFEIQAGIVFFVLIWSLYLNQKQAITNP